MRPRRPTGTVKRGTPTPVVAFVRTQKHILSEPPPETTDPLLLNNLCMPVADLCRPFGALCWAGSATGSP
jgi:hypothetical protein